MNTRLSYTYWSYEEYRRAYIGVRLCPNKYPTPELDIHYFGSYKDKTFNPTHKIILNVFDNHEDAKDEEVELHNAFDVGRNPHFANLAKQTSTGFSTAGFQHNEESKQKMAEAKKGENNPNYDKKHTEENKKIITEAAIRFHKENPDFIKGENNPNYGRPAPNRNQEVWNNYDLIKELHTHNPELGHIGLCKLFNKTFGTNYKEQAFKSILPKIKDEIVQINSLHI